MTSRLDELRSLDLFGGLGQQQLAELVAASTEISLRSGLELFREGEHADFWWVLLDGVIDLVRQVGSEETVVARMDAPGRWAGGFRAWDDQGVYLATGRAVTTGRVLRIPAEVLRERVSAWFPPGSRAGRAGAGRPGGGPGVVADPPWCRPRMGDRAWPSPRPGPTSAGATRAAGVLAGPALEPGLEWVAGALSVAPLLAEMKESSRRISSADRRGQVLLADGPCVDAAHRRHRGPREHPGHAQP